MTAPLAPPINTNNVVVGPAAVYLAPKFTPMAADSSILFDPTNWTGKTLTLNGATSVTLQVVNRNGTATTAALATIATMTAAQLQTAIAALANVGAGNVVVTGSVGGPFQIVFANSLGATTFSVSASTGGTGPTVTSGLWVAAGCTEAGWTFGSAKQIQDINVEEQSTPVQRTIASQSVSIGANLSEDTFDNLQFSLNAVKSLIAQGVGQPGVTVLTLSDVLQHYAVALEALNEFNLPKRYYIPDAQTAESLSIAFRRSAAQRFQAVSFVSVCPTNLIVARTVTAPGL